MSPTARQISKRPKPAVVERSRQACDRCRLSKLKCDDRHPCQACRAKGLACFVSDSRRGPGRPKAVKVTGTISSGREGRATPSSLISLDVESDHHGGEASMLTRSHYETRATDSQPDAPVPDGSTYPTDHVAIQSVDRMMEIQDRLPADVVQSMYLPAILTPDPSFSGSVGHSFGGLAATEINATNDNFDPMVGMWEFPLLDTVRKTIPLSCNPTDKMLRRMICGCMILMIAWVSHKAALDYP
jgi:hypothetical protein